MKLIAWFLLSLCSSTFAILPAVGMEGAIEDVRYCGEPARHASGTIKRSQTVIKRFAETFPCPATLEPTSVCLGWAIDHIIPLANGGCDSTVNMMWLPDELKSCAGKLCKDRWERHYHAFPRQKVIK